MHNAAIDLIFIVGAVMSLFFVLAMVVILATFIGAMLRDYIAYRKRLKHGRDLIARIEEFRNGNR